MLQRIKEATKTQEFKDILSFEDVKGTVGNLNNIFYGSMLIACAMFLYWLYQVLGAWLVGIPILYILTCYVGRFIKLVVETKQPINK